MTKNKSILLLLGIIVGFFVLNSLWIKLDNQLPMIGDDARWLEETNRLTQTIKTGDINLIWQKWQDTFIKDTNSFPRTPLFVLLSVPVFFFTGPNENAAIIFNAFVFALTGVLLYFFCQKIFEQNKFRKEIGLISVLLFNLYPGYYGFARLYMSEILQVFFVLLITFFIYKFKDTFSIRVWFFLGLLLALAMLLRFLMPIYIGLPVVYFLFKQFKLIKKFPAGQIIIKTGFAIIFFMIGFLPVFLSWFGKNLVTYWEFTKYTSSGELANIATLGPVLSPITMLRFWKVIALWHFSWPLVLFELIILIIILFKSKAIGLKIFYKEIISRFSFKGFNIGKIFTNNDFWNGQDVKAFLALIILPLPAFLIATFSLNKTARYFLPVEFFWIIVFGYLIVFIWQYKNLIIRGICVIFLLLLSYQFAQGFLPSIRVLPQTGFILTTGHYQPTDSSQKNYDYLYNFFQKELAKNQDLKIYLVPEQTTLNDAELIWYFTQKGMKINTIGEFSVYNTLDQGYTKLDLADYVIVNTKPNLAEKYYLQYSQIVSKIKGGNFLKITEDENLGLIIFVKVV